MSVSVPTKLQSIGGGSHPSDGPLQAIEYAVKELLTINPSQAEVLARWNRISNDPALGAAIAAAVQNRIS